MSKLLCPSYPEFPDFVTRVLGVKRIDPLTPICEAVYSSSIEEKVPNPSFFNIVTITKM